MASYIKYLIIEDVADMDYPEFQASEQVEQSYIKAKQDEENGRLIKVDNTEEFFENL